MALFFFLYHSFSGVLTHHGSHFWFVCDASQQIATSLQGRGSADKFRLSLEFHRLPNQRSPLHGESWAGGTSHARRNLCSLLWAHQDTFCFLPQILWSLFSSSEKPLSANSGFPCTTSGAELPTASHRALRQHLPSEQRLSAQTNVAKLSVFTVSLTPSVSNSQCLGNLYPTHHRQTPTRASHLRVRLRSSVLGMSTGRDCGTESRRPRCAMVFLHWRALSLDVLPHIWRRPQMTLSQLGPNTCD